MINCNTCGDKIQEDIRWKYGVPPTGNTDYAWLQHIIHNLVPNRVMVSVLANGSLSSNTSNEGVIRANMVRDDIVDCIVARAAMSRMAKRLLRKYKYPPEKAE